MAAQQSKQAFRFLAKNRLYTRPFQPKLRAAVHLSRHKKGESLTRLFFYQHEGFRSVVAALIDFLPSVEPHEHFFPGLFPPVHFDTRVWIETILR